ncbi:anti-sigma factor [Arenicella xantha]|uniref:Anti-sigma-K factor RskA n=1 Tax=Arenicella xantha TaxID=644221 RepID=A0A395JN78_9GAMM|nr:anti-sigma factor [Arenicella xantha]RBP53019.1 anti-sigma-K factor RskA [Arenicella xantha]
MRYQNPELRAQLSAAYVVGTLQGLARQRFQSLLQSDASYRDEVAKWEQHFSHLDGQSAAVTPSSSTWSAIQTRLFGEAQKHSSSTSWWRGLAVLASAALIAMFVLQWNQRPPAESDSFDFVAVMQTADSQPLWSITLSDQGRKLEAVALKVPALPSQQDYELWLLAGEGVAPVSLGLLPKSGVLTRQLIDVSLDGASALAVSREVEGGSVSGAPAAGAVLYVAPLYSAS